MVNDAFGYEANLQGHLAAGTGDSRFHEPRCEKVVQLQSGQVARRRSRYAQDRFRGEDPTSRCHLLRR